MTDPVSFYRLYVSTINQFINTLEDLRTQNDRLASEPTLAADAAAAALKSGRPDLTAQSFINAQAALVQLLFTFDSGSPTQKSFLFKML